MNISGLLGDLYDSAANAAVTELPVRHADAEPDAGVAPGVALDVAPPSNATEPVPAEQDPGELDATAGAREAELRAARIRAEEAAASPSATNAGAASEPLTFLHDRSHDDLLPHRAGGRRIRLRR